MAASPIQQPAADAVSQGPDPFRRGFGFGVARMAVLHSGQQVFAHLTEPLVELPAARLAQIFGFLQRQHPVAQPADAVVDRHRWFRNPADAVFQARQAAANVASTAGSWKNRRATGNRNACLPSVKPRRDLQQDRRDAFVERIKPAMMMIDLALRENHQRLPARSSSVIAVLIAEKSGPSRSTEKTPALCRAQVTSGCTSNNSRAAMNNGCMPCRAATSISTCGSEWSE